MCVLSTCCFFECTLQFQHHYHHCSIIILTIILSIEVNRLDIRLSEDERLGRRGDFVGNLSQLVLNKPDITLSCKQSPKKKSVVVVGEVEEEKEEEGCGGREDISCGGKEEDELRGGCDLIDIGSEESDNNKSNGDYKINNNNDNRNISNYKRTVIDIDKTMSILKETKYSPTKYKNNNSINNTPQATKTINIKEIIINENNNNNKNSDNNGEKKVIENKGSCRVVVDNNNNNKNNDNKDIDNNKNDSNNNINNVSSSLDLLSAYESADEDLDDDNNNDNDNSINNNDNNNAVKNKSNNNLNNTNNKTNHNNNENNVIKTNNNNINGDSGDDLEISYQTLVKKKGRRKSNDVKTSEPIKLAIYFKIHACIIVCTHIFVSTF